MTDFTKEVAELHADVDATAAPIVASNAARMTCKLGCTMCCTDGLTVFVAEAMLIRANHPEVLLEAPGPPGACAFLSPSGACRVYQSRPYVCRTQGLPLKWLEEDEDEEIIEQRDICPLNLDGGPPLAELGDEECWQIGPFEDRLMRLQYVLDEGAFERVELRALFSQA